MKKIFVLNGSRRKEGNTAIFVKKIIEKLDKNIFETEFAYPQDYKYDSVLDVTTVSLIPNVQSKMKLNFCKKKY